MEHNGTTTPDGNGGTFYHASDDNTGTSYPADASTHAWALLSRAAGRTVRDGKGLCQHAPDSVRTPAHMPANPIMYALAEQATGGEDDTPRRDVNWAQLILDIVCVLVVILSIVWNVTS